MNIFHRLWMCSLACLPMLLASLTAYGDDSFAAIDSAADDPRQASAVVRQLQARQDLQLTDVLSAMNDKSSVAKNWYLSLAQAIADRDPENSTKELNQFLPKLSEDPNARYWAFTYLTRDKPDLREDMLESMLADPCLELRYEAVALRLDRLKAAEGLSEEAKKNAYQELLAAARLPAQVQEVASRLEELGQDVDLLEHFGFISRWKTTGPFDNIGQASFDVVYPPEEAYESAKLQLTQTYPGKTAPVGWKDADTKEEDGGIDLNAIYDNEKGAIVYALGEFNSPAEQDCEVRIGSANAVKVWVNGELLISREVYHAGSQVDQYTAPAKLKAGSNSVLVKVCQNEQTEDWAQDFKFQLRFTDSSGFAIQPSN